ncbi:MAG: CDP-diacylglycerol--glycerol-3-phosphate 3-phosphatidyltransferase [Acholeplasmataceae bacterium]
MTIANKLTLARLIIIPVMVIAISVEGLKGRTYALDMHLGQWAFAVLFVIATLTDFLDGYIARKYDQVTTFGKFLDPLADKVLVVVALLYLMASQPDRVPLWAVTVVIFREFMVTGIRLLAVEKRVVIAASPYGKAKTAVTMVALTLLLFNDLFLPVIVADVLFWAAIVLTALSGVDYAIKNRSIIFEAG